MSASLVAVIGDVHFPHVHLPTWRAFNAWMRHVCPDRLVINGDFFDLPQVSSHAPEVSQGVEILPPLQRGAKAVARLADCVGDGGADFIEGNHDARLYKKLIQPLAYTLRGLEHMFSLESVVRAHGLPQSVRWHIEDCSHAHAPVTIGQYDIRHGHNQAGRFGGGRTPAATLLHKDAGGSRSLVMGHFHRPQIYTCGNRTFVVNGHMEAPVHFAGGNDGWCRGWLVLYHDHWTDTAQAVPMWSNSGRFVWQGEVFDGNEEAPPRAEDGEFRVSFTADRRRSALIHWGSLDGVTLSDVADLYGVPYQTFRKRWSRHVKRHGVPKTSDTFEALLGLEEIDDV